MTGRRAVPVPHLPSVLGRARASRGSLALAGVVVALATFLASAVPLAIRTTADRAVADAVTRAGDDAALVVDAPFDSDYDDDGARTVQPDTAAAVLKSTQAAQEQLGARFAGVVQPPVATVKSAVLGPSDTSLRHTLQLIYVLDRAGPRVSWTAGGPPAATTRSQAGLETGGGSRWPVQVGLSEQNAAAVGVRPGDRVHVQDRQNRVLDVRVSGIFRAADPQDPAWRSSPQLLRPTLDPDGYQFTRVAGLLSAASLPDARFALQQDQLRCTIVFTPTARNLTWDRADELGTAVSALQASSASFFGELSWQSLLPEVLRAARSEVSAAYAQAAVLLQGLITTLALVLVLAADLLVRRRSGQLGLVRARGASLPAIGLESLVESAGVTVAGAAVGLALSRLLAGGTSWRWAVPVLLVALLGGPVLAVRQADREVAARRVPANRSARRSFRLTGQVRRLAAEAAVLIAAAGAFAALAQRGVTPARAQPGGADVLAAAAPTLGVLAAGLLLLRLLPPGLGFARRRALRTRGGLTVLAVARAAVTAVRPLPFLVVVVSSALLAYALSLSATQARGQADGAWQDVGADARVHVTPPASVSSLAARAARAPGVRSALTARVDDGVPVVTPSSIAYARLVVVDTAAFQRLLAATPLPDAPQLARLHATGRTSRVGPDLPVLVRSPDGSLRPGEHLTVRWNGTVIGLTGVGTAPAVGAGGPDVLVVDAATFAAAGAKAPPDTLWLVGPGAAKAVAAGVDPGTLTLRQAVVHARETAPLAGGLRRLAVVSAGLLGLLGLLGVALGAAAGAQGRAETLARLGTLGLRRRQARLVTVGELLPAVLLGAAGGAGTGVLLARLSLSLLDLRLLTGQASAPTLVLPWLTVAPVALLALVVVAVGEVEHARRRSERLGTVLRAGGP